jgi:Protein of unknown function (DUF1592)/Protein of unknown function (DUF1588)/Protein of unknown function (DUF1587)/Protein of unknown function (DUF1595)/Protein of unknown function (DUF1585)
MRVLMGLVCLVGTAYCQTTLFSEKLYPIFNSAGCPACHNGNGVASVTRLHFPDTDASQDRVEAFGRSLVRFIDRDHLEESLLLKKPTMRISHTGGLRIKPGSSDEVVLKAWIQNLTSLSTDELAKAMNYSDEDQSAGTVGAPVAVLRRLTHSQYNNTVRDLLADQTAPANQFPPEDFAKGFKNQYDAQNLSPILAEAYSAAAEKIARNAFRNGDTHALIPCKPSAECRERFARSFGLRAFRRPLDAGEVKRYTGLFALDKDFVNGAQLVVEAMLQSSNFLFRLDETSNPKWKRYAAASRLSYTLWDTMPDAALMDEAAHGELEKPSGVERIARRMLQDPRAHQALDEFVSQWLRFDRVLSSSRDRLYYPRFSLETALAMTEEARQFIADLVWNDRNFMTAFTANYGFVNADLAGIYGVPTPKQEFQRVEFPAESERAGLLGQALFLALSSKPDDTSVTGRGLFVREQFLCQQVPPPPAGVNTNLTPSTEAHPQTNRERMNEHVLNKFCANCHNLIDPIGFGFEKFDAVGARRDQYKLLFYIMDAGDNPPPPKTVSLKIDTSGWVAGIPDSHFSSPRELGGVLAKTPQCQECVVKQYFRYTTGRMEIAADYPILHKVCEDFRNSQFRFQQLIISLIRNRESLGAERAVHVARNYQAR